MAPAAEWRQVPFQEALQRVNGKPYQVDAAQYRETGEIPVVDQGKSLVAGFSDRHDKRFRVPPGGLIVFGDHTRIVKFVDFDFVVGADGTQLMVGRPGFSTRLLAYVLQHHEVPSTGYNRHFKFLLDQVYLLPSDLAEQEALGCALSDVDALLAKLDQLIAKKRDLKQAAMQQLLTGRRRLHRFTGRWDDRNLASLGSLLKGRGVTRDQANSGSIACVRYGEIYTTHHDIVRDITSWISPTVAATATRLKCGDILFAGSGETKEEIGKCVAFIDDFEAYAGGDIVILRPRGVDSRFLGYALNTPEVSRQKANFGQGDAVVHISAAALGSVTVRLPPLDEQVAIGTVLADMDAELAVLEARREKTRHLKQGMMQALLTGRIRLV